ncbi:MAG: YgjP-like metallopeptidase domain-containing protein [Thermodesulfobacteriota bacterium]
MAAKGSLRRVDEIDVLVIRKRMKNLRLRVREPKGEVCLSAPHHASWQAIDSFVRSQQGWIKARQGEIAARGPRPELCLEDGEIHLFFGREYELRLREVSSGRHLLRLTAERRLELAVRQGTSRANRRKVLDRWYRERLGRAIDKLVAKWQPRLAVTVTAWTIRAMSSRWGSCNVGRGRLSINLDLVRLPRPCLEYVVVHEMVHLLEPGHNKRFWSLLDQHLPAWREAKALLHGQWGTPAGQDDWSVYMVRCADDSLYTGIAKDLGQRLAAHNSAKGGAKYTKARQPVALVYQEGGLTHSQAARREWAIKKLSRLAKLALVRDYQEGAA